MRNETSREQVHLVVFVLTREGAPRWAHRRRFRASVSEVQRSSRPAPPGEASAKGRGRRGSLPRGGADGGRRREGARACSSHPRRRGAHDARLLTEPGGVTRSPVSQRSQRCGAGVPEGGGAQGWIGPACQRNPGSRARVRGSISQARASHARRRNLLGNARAGPQPRARASVRSAAPEWCRKGSEEEKAQESHHPVESVPGQGLLDREKGLSRGSKASKQARRRLTSKPGAAETDGTSATFFQSVTDPAQRPRGPRVPGSDVSSLEGGEARKPALERKRSRNLGGAFGLGGGRRP